MSASVAMSTRKRSSMYIEEKPLLHTEGYQIYHGALKIPDNILRDVQRLSEKAPAIFNNNIGRRDDRKRRQCTLTASKLNKTLKNFLNQANNFIKKYITTELAIKDWVVIHSRAGCQDQAAHTDYVPNEDLANASDEEMPLSVIVCLMDETTLNVWPKSIGLSTNKDAALASHEPIQCKVVHLKRGDMLAFHGDLVHAGSGYKKENWRMHAFLDSAAVERKSNTTWIIHKHAGKEFKRIIQ